MPTRTIPGQRRQTHLSVTPVLIPRSTIERPVMASKENTYRAHRNIKIRGGAGGVNKIIRLGMP